MENSPSQERRSRIKPPNLDRVGSWIRRNIREPFVDFRDLTHPDGRKFTVGEQLAASRRQVRTIVTYWRDSGVPDQQIQTDLIKLVTET